MSNQQKRGHRKKGVAISKTSTNPQVTPTELPSIANRGVRPNNQRESSPPPPPAAEAAAVFEEEPEDSELAKWLLDRALASNCVQELRARNDKMTSVYVAIHANETFGVWRRGLKDAVDILEAEGMICKPNASSVFRLSETERMDVTPASSPCNVEPNDSKCTQTEEPAAPASPTDAPPAEPHSTSSSSSSDSASPPLIDLPPGIPKPPSPAQPPQCCHSRDHSEGRASPPEFSYSMGEDRWQESVCCCDKQPQSPLVPKELPQTSESPKPLGERIKQWVHLGSSSTEPKAPVPSTEAESKPTESVKAKTGIRGKAKALLTPPASPQGVEEKKGRWRWSAILSPRGQCVKDQSLSDSEESIGSGEKANVESVKTQPVVQARATTIERALRQQPAVQQRSRSAPCSNPLMPEPASGGAEMEDLVEQIMRVCSAAQPDEQPHQKKLLLNFAANQLLADRWLQWERRHRRSGC